MSHSHRAALRWPWLSRSKCPAALICLKGWNRRAFLHLFDWTVNDRMLVFCFFSFSFWHISMFCMHRKGGLEQEMSLRRWAVHYSADSRSANLEHINAYARQLCSLSTDALQLSPSPAVAFLERTAEHQASYIWLLFHVTFKNELSCYLMVA